MKPLTVIKIGVVFIIVGFLIASIISPFLFPSAYMSPASAIYDPQASIMIGISSILVYCGIAMLIISAIWWGITKKKKRISNQTS